MKSTILMTILGFAMSAQASHFVEYKDEALRLLTYVQKSCPNEFAEAMKHANVVKSATLTGGMMQVELDGKLYPAIGETMVIITSRRYISGETEMAKVTIEKESIPEPVFVPSKPTEYKITCKVEVLAQN